MLFQISIQTIFRVSPIDQDKLYVKEGSNLVDASTTDISGKADLAGPTFTGVPAAPTANAPPNTRAAPKVPINNFFFIIYINS